MSTSLADVRTRTAETWHPELGFGDRLRRIRLAVDMNQRDFSAAIGMKPAAYGHHELRAESPQNARLIANAIQAVFGVDAGWTLGTDEPVITRRYQRVPGRIRERPGWRVRDLALGRPLAAARVPVLVAA